jgi:hypothetical protein
VATYACTIAGTPKTIQPGVSITETANGRGRLACDVLSAAGTYRPAIGAEVILTEDVGAGAVRIFGGTIDSANEAGFGGLGVVPIVTKITAVDFNQLAERRYLNITIPTGNLKAALTAILPYLTPAGVTLDAAQVNGPTLPALPFSYMRVDEALNQLATLSTYIWQIDYNKVLRMVLPSATAAPFNVVTGDGNALGDITVEPSRQDYANRVIVLAGDGLKEVTDTFTGDGVTTTFTLKYPLTASRGYVTNNAAVETLGAGATWTYNATTNQITRSAAPANTNPIIIIYTAQFPVLVYADDAAALAADGGVYWEKIVREPQVFDVAVAQALATAYVAQAVLRPRTVRYVTQTPGIHPGQSQTINTAARNLNATFLVTDVTIRNATGNIVERQVTATEGTLFVGSWRDTVKGWGGSTSASGGGGIISIVSGGGASPGSGTIGKLAKWASVSTLGDSILTEAGATVTVAGTLAATTFSGSGAGLSSLPAAALTGTVPAAALTGRSLADLGTRSASDLSSGNLPYAQLPTGSGTWGATPTISGAVTCSSTLAVTGIATFTTHALPATTDTADLGRFDRLWNQAYISQLNAIVFAQTTATLFGGYSTIGKSAGTFAADVATAATSINFGQAMTPGQWVLVRAHDTSGTIRAEYLLVGTLVSGTTYNVTRDLAAVSSPDPAWASGTPFLVLGVSGDGRIDMFAFDGKPRIVFTTQGATYNAQSDRAVIGNLNGYYSYATDVYGAAFGDPAGANLVIDATNGLRIRQGATVYAQLASSTFTLGAAGGNRVAWDGTNLTVVSATVSITSAGINLVASGSGAYADLNAYTFSAAGVTTTAWGLYGTYDASHIAGLRLAVNSDVITLGYAAGVTGVRLSNLTVTGGTTLGGFTSSAAGIVNAAFTVNGNTVLTPSTGYALAFSGGAIVGTGIFGAISLLGSGIDAVGVTSTDGFLYAAVNGGGLKVLNAAAAAYLQVIGVDGLNQTFLHLNTKALRIVSGVVRGTIGTYAGSFKVTVDGGATGFVPVYT